jgi:hypothetical protein
MRRKKNYVTSFILSLMAKIEKEKSETCLLTMNVEKKFIKLI